jgi:hypothetical protein
MEEELRGREGDWLRTYRINKKKRRRTDFKGIRGRGQHDLLGLRIWGHPMAKMKRIPHFLWENGTNSKHWW